MDELFEQGMSDSDDLMWTIERDPVLRSTITAVSLLDEAPDWARLVARMRRVVETVPRLHQRVQPRPLRVARPDWVDTDLDLDYHLRRVALPAPGTVEQVLELARVNALQGFDLERPLWEFTVVEGLAGGGAAFIQKVHHTMTDGIGGVRLALELLDAEADPPDERPWAGSVRRPGRSTLAALLDQRGGRAVAAMRRTPGMALRSLAAAARHPVGAALGAAVMARSLGHMLAPVPEPLSPVFRGRGLDWRFDAFDVPLEDLRAAARRAGGSINDVFLAAVTMALRDYHRAHNADPHELYMTLPVSLRRRDDPLGGNRFTPLRFKIPIDGPDGDERIRAVSALVKAERAEPAVAATPLLAAVLDSLPAGIVTPVFGGMLKNVDFVATNVPGVPHRCWLAGAEVLRQYAFAPPSGAAANIALLSHGETACIGIVADTTPVKDHDLLARCLADAFASLLHTTHVHVAGIAS